jgi:rSAM/selenodomain-associated transferase 2
MTPELAVVIPCLNEADALPLLLRDLAAQRGIALEVVVADGGSSDRSTELARLHGAQLVSSPRGRGRQMNAGARASRAPWLLFLHADSRLGDPDLLNHALQALREAAAAQGGDCVAGHFALRFERRDARHALAWRYVEEKTAFNRPYCTNGDQGLLLSRRYFEALHGFDEDLPLLEDQRLCARIRASGTLVTLPGHLATSARRFEQAGFHRQYLLMALIMAMQAAGIETFFRRAPGLYPPQHETGRLRLLPFLRLARDGVRQAGRWRSWLRIGRLGRENAWQLFYFLDVLLRPWLGPGRYPCLRFYARAIEPVTANRLYDGIADVILWLHFHMLVLPWAWLSDRRAARRAAAGSGAGR